MALKKKITKEAFDKLPDALKTEYVANGDEYVLDVEGEEDTGALKRAKDREKQRADEAEAKLKDAEKKLNETSDLDARKKGDIETLEKSWSKKLLDRETELTGQLTKAQTFARKSLIDGTASALATAISTVPGLMTKAIKERLQVDFDGEEPTLRILDATGKPSASTMEDLKKEFLTNKEYASILIGSKASGGGAPSTGKKAFGGAEDGKPQMLSKMKPGELAAAIKARKENEQNNE